MHVDDGNEQNDHNPEHEPRSHALPNQDGSDSDMDQMMRRMQRKSMRLLRKSATSLVEQ